jgi:predicted lactoylglutathione lyase
MPQMLFVNLPVTDLARSIAFYQAVGATKNDQFSDHTAACMVVSETIYVMLLTHPKFASFTSRQIPDARTTCQVMLALSKDGKAEVDDAVRSAATAGGAADPNPPQDLGFMYGRSYADPDGHIWEVFWMDPKAAAGGHPA